MIEEEKTFKAMLLGYTDYDLKIAQYKWLIIISGKKETSVGVSNYSGLPHGTGYIEGRKQRSRKQGG